MEEKKELTPTDKLSPSKINTFMKCPREFYYNYVEKVKVSPNIHLVKGSVVHKVLEDFYKEYKPNPKKELSRMFKETWKSYREMIKMLEMSREELKVHKKDALQMIMAFYDVHRRKMEGVLVQGKAENEQHAFYLTKPKFKEMYVKDDELRTRGYIDRIHEDYNGIVTLGDYKTSSKYGIGLSEDYKRQLAIYALLYNSQTGKMADFVSIIFLRYGEEFLLEVTPSLLKYARDSIDYVWNRTRSANIEDYPLKESRLCGWCAFNHICSGGAKYRKENDKKRMLDLIKKVDENEKSKIDKDLS